jgi:hypothetical protein
VACLLLAFQDLRPPDAVGMVGSGDPVQAGSLNTR